MAQFGPELAAQFSPEYLRQLTITGIGGQHAPKKCCFNKWLTLPEWIAWFPFARVPLSPFSNLRRWAKNAPEGGAVSPTVWARRASWRAGADWRSHFWAKRRKFEKGERGMRFLRRQFEKEVRESRIRTIHYLCKTSTSTNPLWNTNFPPKTN